MDACTPCFAKHMFIVKFISHVLLFAIENIFAFRANFYQTDSYGSPFYNPSLSETEIVRRAIARSVNKSNIITLNSPVASLAVLTGSQYLMRVCLGTPPVDIVAAADTGSALTWTQCEHCTQCMPQRFPLFKPHASSSYTKFPCGHSVSCPPLSRCQTDGCCRYDIFYADGTYSKGMLSADTMRMESTLYHQPIVEIHKYKFGCGTNNGGLVGGIASGIIGLGVGSLSFVSQLGPHANNRFSYCLIPLSIHKGVSHIRFGHDAIVDGPETVTIPLVNKEPLSQYYVTLEAFTVGRTRVNFTGKLATVEDGNIAIDSGTALMWLPRFFYDQIKHVVANQVSASPLPDPYKMLDLCYKNDAALHLPNIVANFRGGDIPLKPYNVFSKIGHVTCLTFIAEERHTIYGVLAQQGFIIGYDTSGSGTVSFKPFDCTNF